MGIFCSEAKASHLGAMREPEERTGNEAGCSSGRKADDEGNGEARCCCGR